ncbi:MAG: hypothetical protein Q9162_006208 [Coniocarpon cinnabarinum]
MVVLNASICTRGGKAVLSRSFREIPRSRIEGLLAALPKLLDLNTQHTTVEQDNVRYVYQPLDELYMVLITNRQSNILQDIDSLHLFAQVTSSICRSLDEREIHRMAYDLISAWNEVVNLGYRENLTLNQIKTFLEMESHEERVAMIIEQNKQMEADEQRKRRAKEIERQRLEQQRAQRAQMPVRPTYPSYNPPTVPTTVVSDPMDSYNAEKNKSKNLKPAKQGLVLGKKNRAANAFDAVRQELGPEDDAPLVGAAQPSQPPSKAAPASAAPIASRASLSGDREAVHVTFGETINAQISREGTQESFEVSGSLQLRITDPSMTQIKLQMLTDSTGVGAQYTTHPKVDKNVFLQSKVVQLKDTTKGFPSKGAALEVLRWKYNAKSGSEGELPLMLTAWINEGDEGSFSITVEYELTGGDALRDVAITIPYGSNEPRNISEDAIYEVGGDSLEWQVGGVDSDNGSGSFEFEAEADGADVFFPMSVRFAKSSPFVGTDVAGVTLINMGQNVPFSKDIRSQTGNYRMV